MALHRTLLRFIFIPRSARPCFAGLVAVAVIAASLATAARSHAMGQEEQVAAATTPSPYAEPQFATLSGTTNTVTLSSLPVVLSNGSVVYKNVTIPINVSESTTGAVTLTAGAISSVPAPVVLVSAFKSGPYQGPGGTNTELLTLTGPGVTSGGATEWTLSSSGGATGCTYPNTATFYVGPLASNPLITRLKKAGITSTAYSYGIMGTQPCSVGNQWYNGNIIGVSQTGNALNIVSFSDSGVSDQNTPTAQITYIHK